MVKPIFDEENPKENNWLFRLANRLHIPTSRKVIRDDLLFKVDESIDQNLLDSSERSLNTRRYLNQASVEHVQNPCTGQSEVNVEVRDVWTLKPKLSFSHSGGNSNSNYGFEDSNFLGTGKAVSIMQFSNEQRSGSIIDYHDPNTGAYNSQLRLRYSDNDDGIEKRITLNRPFLDLSTKWTGEVNHDDTTMSESSYVGGEKIANFGHRKIVNSANYGRRIDSFSVDGKYANRVILGVSKEEDLFTPSVDSLTSRVLPEGRSNKSLWFEYQNIHDGYIKTSNVRQINRAEYFNLGNQFRARFGFVTSNLNSNDDGYIIQAENNVGTILNENHMILHNIVFNGHYTDNGLVDSVLESDVSWYWKNISYGQFLTQLSASKGYSLYQDHNIVLDGDTGMRGYPSHYQTGDRKVLFTMEQHFFGEREWFSLFHAGTAVFFDAGRAWGDANGSALAETSGNTGWIKDIGIGLRLSPTRTGNKEEGAHGVLHMDIVKPLDRSDGISNYQWRLSTEKRF
ncbi:hypothetical protein AB4876_01150 [Zhongshania guokunii]|uniref:Bacterial surface antigen (D15) domain-containing protein n=1 Tax=Zhongshania guokunii TaxID=641783 RepID=A0ABV3U1I5_9GAMM